ncbi:hypothetical protein TNCV_4783731 [Trichonephila clavipes]|nr:hypothetical protein TNCV_4783731 [Trichonephila clavipes]
MSWLQLETVQPSSKSIVISLVLVNILSSFIMRNSNPYFLLRRGLGVGCDEAVLFPLITKRTLCPLPKDVGKIPDISLIPGKEFWNWEVKDLVPFSQTVPGNKKRRINIVLSFFHNSVTTARLTTYNVHSDISAHWARDDRSRY